MRTRSFRCLCFLLPRCRRITAMKHEKAKIKGKNAPYEYSKCRKLPDFSRNREEQAALSHWVHLANTRFSRPYQKTAERLLPQNVRDALTSNCLAEGDPNQLLFPDLLDVPFPPPQNPKFTFIDLFAGIGGFRLAMQSVGGMCVFSSEWNESAQRTYFANYGEMPFGDITKAETKAMIPHGFEVLCAGFPCQPFSRAGVSARLALNQATGFEDKAQGTLFFDVLTVLKERRPKIAFLENVKNLVRHDGGRTFEIIRESIRELGYSFHWKIIDASPLVPQKRIRCYMVCVHDNGDFAFPEIGGPEKPLSSVLEPNPADEYTISDGLWRGHQARTQRNLARGAGFTAFTADLSKPAHTLVSRYYKDGKECLIPQEGKNPRLLTRREAARLQGFPETFILPASRTETYRQMGNSVAVPVLRKIAENIVAQVL